MKVAVVDYGMGNLGSVCRALSELGAEPRVAESPAQLSSADRLVLPGVGSFGEGMENLAAGGWIDEIRREVREMGKPLLGICLGMQLLAARGTEAGGAEGIGLLSGEVMRLDSMGCSLRLPHVGWNSVSLTAAADGLFAGIASGTDFYFVHSFAYRPTDQADVLAYTDYGIPVVAAVGQGSVLGTQFHPEKSSKAGFRLLRNFLELPPC